MVVSISFTPSMELFSSKIVASPFNLILPVSMGILIPGYFIRGILSMGIPGLCIKLMYGIRKRTDAL